MVHITNTKIKSDIDALHKLLAICFILVKISTNQDPGNVHVEIHLVNC